MPRAPAPKPVPLRALIMSLAALAVPVVGVFAFTETVQEEQGVLVWMTALVPAFLLAYYRGLKGVAVALAAGMAVLSLTQATVLALGAPSPNWAWLLAVIAAYVGICIGVAVFAEILHRERQAAESMALTDALTRIPNRRHAETVLSTQFGGAVRGRALAVVLFDLDHFKQVNDKHGHDAGDEALRVFASVLVRNTRRMDLSARFGGEEFISVLADAHVEEAIVFAERVRRDLAQHQFSFGQVTASAGVASYQDGMGSWELLIAAADRALYAAKAAGRNRVVAAGRAGPPLKPPAPTRAPVPAAAAARDAGARGEAILVVDDDPDAARAVVRVLQRAGYRVEQSDDPIDVIRRYEGGERPHVLITDVMMPEMSGLTLVDHLVGFDPDLRVVYMSGYVQRPVSWAGFPGKIVAFLEKPAEIHDVLSTVRSVLDRHVA
jgi:diguanylate cyclase (GGDEF)-like protein